MQERCFEVHPPLNRPPRIITGGLSAHRPGSTLRFCFDDIWSMHCYQYRFDLELDGQVFQIRPGMVSIIPPGVRMVYRFPSGPCRHWYVLFELSPSRQVQSCMGIRAEDASSDGLNARFRQVACAAPHQPPRARAGLWDVLWRMAEHDASARPAASPDPAEQVATAIRARLSEPLRVAALASEVGLSHNQLTRQFRQRFGQTVIDYIQQLRIEQAEHLLRQTTMPIKAVAVEVGMPDPHHFNKAIRRTLGASPTAIRGAARS